MTLVFDIEQVARRIRRPVTRWPGNCNSVAVAMLKHVPLPEGTVNHFGTFQGPVTDRWHKWSGRPFHHHGWLATRDGTIIDPTRWAFTGEEPYIYVGPNRAVPGQPGVYEYDWGAQGVRRMMRPPFPLECEVIEGDVLSRFHKNCKDVSLEMPPGVFELLPKDIFGDPVFADEYDAEASRGRPNITLRTCQAMWLANTPPDDFGFDGEAFIRYLIRDGHGAWVPADTRQWAMGEVSTVKV